MNQKVCVCLVTYNRKKYLKTLLKALDKQTYKIDSIIIVNNCSTDDTHTMLHSLGYVNKKIEFDKIKFKKRGDLKVYYYCSSYNSGGSGGFSNALDIFLKNSSNFDYAWVMDDDVLPKPKCLENLLKCQSDIVKVTIPNRSTGLIKDYPVIDLRINQICLRPKKCKRIDKETYAVQAMPFEGPLVSKEIVLKVGIPNKEWFITYDDTDYCVRCLNFTKVIWVRNAQMSRQLLISNKPIKYKFCWKDYYDTRNGIIFIKKYCSNRIVKPIKICCFALNKILPAIIKFKFTRLKILIPAVVDGLSGKMGKREEKN